MKKTTSQIIAIDDARKSSNSQPFPPLPPCGGKKLSSNAMTRRTFAGLFFGFGMSFNKAARQANCTLTAASEEARKHGYEHWAMATGRRAA